MDPKEEDDYQGSILGPFDSLFLIAAAVLFVAGFLGGMVFAAVLFMANR